MTRTPSKLAVLLLCGAVAVTGLAATAAPPATPFQTFHSYGRYPSYYHPEFVYWPQPTRRGNIPLHGWRSHDFYRPPHTVPPHLLHWPYPPHSMHHR